MKLNPKLLLDVMYPVGSYYETSNSSFNPNTAWGGTWEREDDGTALVSYKSSGAFNKNIETIVGEETHTLTTDEMPSHKHDNVNLASHYLTAWNNKTGNVSYFDLTSLAGNNGTPFGSGIQNSLDTQNTGGDQPHNNVQPSKVVYRWHRTA